MGNMLTRKLTFSLIILSWYRRTCLVDRNKVLTPTANPLRNWLLSVELFIQCLIIGTTPDDPEHQQILPSHHTLFSVIFFQSKSEHTTLEVKFLQQCLLVLRIQLKGPPVSFPGLIYLCIPASFALVTLEFFFFLHEWQ